MSSIDGAVRRPSVVLGSTLARTLGSRPARTLGSTLGSILGSILGGLLVVLLPSLLITGADGASAIAVLAIACAAFVHFGTITLSLTSGRALALPVQHKAEIPLRTGRVTDPTHHPLRPRAPGTA